MKNIIWISVVFIFFTGCVPQPTTPEKSQIKCIAEVIHVEDATIKSYLGAAIGGVTGGVIGYQIGGSKKDNQLAATVGAVGGAFIGSMFDKQNNAQKLTIKADRNREIEAIIKKQERLFQIGDRVEFSMINNEVVDVKLVEQNSPIGCGKFKPSSIAKQCNELAKAGGDNEESHQVYLGNSQGEFILQFETFNAKDQIFVIHDNKVIFDTGCIGTNGWKEARVLYDGFSEELTIKVNPNCLKSQPGTKWEFKVLCQNRNISQNPIAIQVRKFIGVMTQRDYDSTTNVWKYKVLSKDGKDSINFESNTKIMYKNDLISFNILNQNDVDIGSIKLLERNYIQTQKQDSQVKIDSEPVKIEKKDEVKTNNSAESLF
jgi:outer membrane lipoprotein SlyB